MCVCVSANVTKGETINPSPHYISINTKEQCCGINILPLSNPLHLNIYLSLVLSFNLSFFLEHHSDQ